MSDNFDKILKQLRHHSEILKHHKRPSGTIGKIITNMKEAQIQLNRYPDSAEAKAAVSQVMKAKDSAKSAIDAANTYIDIVAEILGENTVSEEVLAFLRVENRLTDLNMAEVSLFEVGEYGALKSRPGRDGMEMDHIPSKAALCKVTCRYIEDKIDKKLNDMEVAAVLKVVEKLGGAIAVPKEMHDKLSRTIRGRNAKTRIHQDSLDIIRAIKADLDAYTPELRKRGYSDKDIEMIYNSLVNRFNHVVEQICQQK
jgi:complete genome; segment 3/17